MTPTRDDEIIEAQMTNLFRRAEDGGLFGVMMLGQRCKACGAIHEWYLQSSIVLDDDESLDARRDAVIGLLEEQLDRLYRQDCDYQRVQTAGRA